MLLGSWILATGVLSCNNNQPAEKSKPAKPEKPNTDTADITCYKTPAASVKSYRDTTTLAIDCYETVLPEDTVADDELRGKADSTIDQPKTCYAPVIDMKPEN